MNIGLDIDNVISDFDTGIKKEFLKEDKNKRNKGIIDNTKHINDGMFDWSKEEITSFYNINMERIAKDLKPRRNCKKYMDKLLKDGHKLYLISHRAYPHYLNPEHTTKEWLKKHKLNYTKLILSESSNKTKECKENSIDVMVDDRVDPCKIMRLQGVNVILMLTKYNKKKKDNLNFATSWDNLYKKLTEKI